MARRARIKRNKPYKINTKYSYFREKKTREEIMSGITNFYSRYQYSKNILNIPVNNDLLIKYKVDPKRSDYVEGIYKRYNLLINKDTNRPFTNEQEYGDYLRKNTPYNDEQIELLWKDYRKVNDLVVTGQYENYRIQSFRDSYIKAMKESGLSDDVISNLEKLSIEQFSLLANAREPNKDKPGKWRLPELGGFNYEIADVKAKRDYAINAELEIRELFREIGLPFKETYYEYVNDVDRDRRYATRYRDYNSTARKTIKRLNIIYNLPQNRANEENYNEDMPVSNAMYLERTVKTMRRIDSKGRQTIRRSKSGEYYIPFIGSTREGTKNRNLLLDIIDILSLEYKN